MIDRKTGREMRCERGCGDRVSLLKTIDEKGKTRWHSVDPERLWVIPTTSRVTSRQTVRGTGDAPAAEWEGDAPVGSSVVVRILTDSGEELAGIPASAYQPGAFSGRRPHSRSCVAQRGVSVPAPRIVDPTPPLAPTSSRPILCHECGSRLEYGPDDADHCPRCEFTSGEDQGTAE